MSQPELAPQWRLPWNAEEGAAQARDLFAREFGQPPTVVTSAPGRVTVIGDHTDYTQGLSLVLPTAHTTFVAVRPRTDGTLRMVSGNPPPGEPVRWAGTLADLTPHRSTDWPDYLCGVVWALGERGYPTTGLDVAVIGCLPLGAGVGASASLTCAFARACDRAWGLALDSDSGAIELAEAAWDAESDYVGFPCGRLDTHTILRCGADQAVMLDFTTAPPTLTLYPLYFHHYGLRILVIDTRDRRDDWMDEFVRRSREAGLAALELGVASLRELADAADGVARVSTIAEDVLRRRARHAVTEDRRVAAAAAALGGLAPAHERFVEIGALMLASHESLRDDYDASTPQLDLAVSAATAGGALGARLAGAGFGGSAIALVRATAAEQVAHHVAGEFADAGYRAPVFMVV